MNVSLLKNGKDPFRMEPQGILWVCVKCMLAHANGVDIRYESEAGMDYDPESNPSPEEDPWTLWIGPDYLGRITMGLLYSEHNEECHVRLTDGRDRDECDCEEREYDTSSCEGCGSSLHGKRHAFTWWK